MSDGDLRLLKEIRDRLTDAHMLECSFYLRIEDCIDRKKLGQQTRLVVDATRVWRESWILPQLTQIIDKYDGQQQRRKGEKP